LKGIFFGHFQTFSVNLVHEGQITIKGTKKRVRHNEICNATSF